MTVLVETQTSTYLWDTEASTISRQPAQVAQHLGEPALVPATDGGPPWPVALLRKDAEVIPLAWVPQEPVVGEPWVLWLRIRDDDVLTQRTTTPVRNVTTQEA